MKIERKSNLVNHKKLSNDHIKNKMIRKITFLAISLLLLSTTKTYAQDDKVIDQIIWVVGDEAILKSDVEKERIGLQARGERMKGDPYCFIPEQLAVQKLYLDQAKIDSIEVAGSSISREVAHYEKMIIMEIGSKERVEEFYGAPISKLRQEWQDMLQNQYLVGEVKKKIVSNKVKLTPSEVRKFYSQLPKDSLPYIPTSVEVQIITTEPTIPLEVIDKVKDRLRDFTNQIQSGQSDFATLAIMYSEDGSASNGGELGFTGRAQWVPEFANVAFSLNDPKKVSNIVETEYGYHIIQMIERRGDLMNARHILLKPKVPAEEINKAISRMDTLVNSIWANKLTPELQKFIERQENAGKLKDGFSFEDAVTFYSSDKDTRNNEGLMVNRRESPYYGTARFRLEDLPAEISTVVDTMKVGQVSAPFYMKTDGGKEVVATVKLRSKTEGHIANISDDYQSLKEIVEGRKREEILKKWVQDKIRKTYVYIEDDWKNCDFQYEGWVKKD